MAFHRFGIAVWALAFALLLACCGTRNAQAQPNSVAAADHSATSELEIVAKAVGQLIHSLCELLRSLSSIVADKVNEGLYKLVVVNFLKISALLTSCDLIDQRMYVSVGREQMLEYRSVATAAMKLRQGLDTAERFEEEHDSILYELVDSLWLKKESNVSLLVAEYTNAVDRRLSEQPQLKGKYALLRREEKFEPLAIDNFSDLQLPLLPQHVKTKLLTAFINKQFLHHSLKRLTLFKGEYFVLARATVELAKRPNKLDQVQQIYDQTLAQVSSNLDVVTATTFDMSSALFKTLRANFEEKPTLNEEWRDTQKYVSQRHEWDRGVWDLDLLPW